VESLESLLANQSRSIPSPQPQPSHRASTLVLACPVSSAYKCLQLEWWYAQRGPAALNPGTAGPEAGLSSQPLAV
jgi:hypothetical protein